MNKLYLVILSLIFPLFLFSQENLPVTQDVQVEVVTSELEKNSKSQNLQVKISCNAAAQGQKLILDLKEIKGLLMPISARRDDESLWLIKSADANENNIVLAWETIDDTRLQLAPGEWPLPYTLDLQIRVSFTNLKDVPNISGTQLDVTMLTGGSESLASPTGRGNQISLKNSRE